LEGGHQHELFFRFRSAAGIDRWQSTEKEHWLFESLKYIDIDEETIANEYVAYAFTLQGMMSYQEWRALRYNRYVVIAAEIERLRAAIKPRDGMGENG
jgi:hypothetical protein